MDRPQDDQCERGIQGIPLRDIRIRLPNARNRRFSGRF